MPTKTPKLSVSCGERSSQRWREAGFDPFGKPRDREEGGRQLSGFLAASLHGLLALSACISSSGKVKPLA